MSIKKIQLDYKKKIKHIKKLNQFYYEKSKPLVTDREYDELKKEILKLEKNNNFLKSKDSPSEAIGFKPSKNFKKFSHRVQMLSLSNAFSEEDLINFEKKIINFLSKDKSFQIYYSAEPKIDGISA